MTDAKDKGKAKAAGDAAAGEVDRIRDIIFGNEMQKYESHFETLKRDLGRLQQSIDQLSARLDEIEAAGGKKLGALRGEMRQADDELRAELRERHGALVEEKVDRTALGQMLTEMGTHLKTGSSLGALLENLEQDE